ncbi:MAG: VanZ family protein [Pseudomonadota bacterium]
MTKKQPVFGAISSAYIASIFLLAEVPSRSELIQSFNPFSLAHIPLYGFLMFLLIKTFLPDVFGWAKAMILPFPIALSVAVLDEINQSFIPGRDSSALDVLLDLAGILVALIIASRRVKRGS